MPREGLPLCQAEAGGGVHFIPGASWPQLDSPVYTKHGGADGRNPESCGVGAVGLSVQALIPISYRPQIIHKVCKSGPSEEHLLATRGTKQGEAVSVCQGKKQFLHTSLQKLVWSGKNPGLLGGKMKLELKAAFMPTGHWEECPHSSGVCCDWMWNRGIRCEHISPVFPSLGAPPDSGPNELCMYPLGSPPSLWAATRTI